MSDAALLEMRNVAKVYLRGREEVRALDGVNLRVAAGELVGLVGPSGSGKSTLLHLAGGLDVADSGTVAFDGRDMAGLSPGDRARLRRRDIGFVFQFFHLLPQLSVAENVELPLLLDGQRRRHRRVVELLQRVGLADRAAHRPGELSGGEMQRAALARALINEPRLVLADEPTGNLDSANGAAVLDLLSQLVTERATALVLATHDTSVSQHASRIVRVHDGAIQHEPDGAEKAVDVTPGSHVR